jgi:signal transduction histidine kinase
VSIAVFRVVQESLANSHKHAGSASRKVQAIATDSQVKVTISDNGSGFEPAEVANGTTLGLVGMRERVELLGGSFSVESRFRGGTEIQAVLPLTSTVASV